MTERDKALEKAQLLYDRFDWGEIQPKTCKECALIVVDEIEASYAGEKPSDKKLVFWYRVRKYINEL